MKKGKDKEEFRKHVTNIKLAGGRLRCAFDNRDLKMFESSSINQVGKLLEYIGAILYDIYENKKPRVEINKLVKCRKELEEFAKSQQEVKK